ncbi:MAG: serine/threonine-protein kinase [Polyangia bacterium]
MRALPRARGTPCVKLTLMHAEPGAGPAPVGTGDLLGGKYRLGQPLGRGAMGTVYAAEHEHLRRAVAVKILHSDLTLRPEQAQRFWREAELVAQLRHPNIVVAYDFGQTEEGSLYYVMERLHGETLRARLNRSPLSDGEIREVLLPLLSALQAAHACGIVHRDIKPADGRPRRLPRQPFPRARAPRRGA